MKNNKFDSLSDETLNSFVDNEFPVSERAELLAYLQTDEINKDKVCQINHIKDMVKTAYSDIPQPLQDFDKKNSKRSRYSSMVASVFFAVVMVGLAYFGLNHGYQDSVAQRLVVLDPDGRGQQLSQNNTDELRVVFHVSNTTRISADELLNDVESLLQLSIQNNQRVRVEVVAHAEGLDLLRERLSTEKKRIASMSKQYPELTFVACLNTAERLEREKGIDVKFIPDAYATRSGVAHIVKRQQQGWLYIQV